MNSTLVIAAACALVVLYFISIYNRFVALQHNCAEAWSNIDVLLKQRFDEIPKLVAVCREYMRYERETFADIAALRERAERARRDGEVAALGGADQALTEALSGLLARSEEYPELRAAESFQQLMARVSVLEESLSDRREFYNETVNINNIRRGQFPDLIIARLFRFGPKALYVVDDEARRGPGVAPAFRAP